MKFRKNRFSLVGAVIISVVVLSGIFAPMIAPTDPSRIDKTLALIPPSKSFPMGTDMLGRDIFSWVVWGCRTSLLVGVLAVLIELVIGFPIGLLSGYIGGWLDEILMRITDVFLTLPMIVFLIVAISFLQVRAELYIITFMALLGWPWMTRLARSSVLSLKELTFIEAARSMDASTGRIILRHVVPNILSPIIVLATCDVAYFILWESALTFLGLGDTTVISWGLMLNYGKMYLRQAWWITTFPGLAIFAATLAFNFLGDGLRDALDVSTVIVGKEAK
jgi:peptide/nickel transport system permease protein